jgi:hypothetical protein
MCFETVFVKNHKKINCIDIDGFKMVPKEPRQVGIIWYQGLNNMATQKPVSTKYVVVMGMFRPGLSSV